MSDTSQAFQEHVDRVTAIKMRWIDGKKVTKSDVGALLMEVDYAWRHNESQAADSDDDQLDEPVQEGYRKIICKECCEFKSVEEGTWAIDNDMCEQCWCEYNGG